MARSSSASARSGRAGTAAAAALAMILAALHFAGAAAEPGRDLDLGDAELRAPGGVFSPRGGTADGSIRQGGFAYTLDGKTTDPRDARITLTGNPACASGEPRLVYELRPPSPGYSAATQKVMHRLHDAREDRQRFDEGRATSFELRFPDAEAFEAPAPRTRALIFQVWQGSPFRPPLALSAVDADAETVELMLHVNGPDDWNERVELARLRLPRETCLRLEIEARPSLPGGAPGRVALTARTAPAAGGGVTLFDGAWEVEFGHDPERPRAIPAERCERSGAPACCRDADPGEDALCRANPRFQALFGLYRRSQPRLMRIEIGDVRHATAP